MSRHTYKGFGKEGRWEITVGWDNPLETFFAQVWDMSADDDEAVDDLRGVEDSCELFVGTSRSEIETIEALVSIVEPYGEVPDDVIDMLSDDHAKRRPPSLLQRWLVR